MRRSRLIAVLVLSSVAALGQGTGGRSLAFVFGPTAEESGKVAAHSAASMALQWLQAPGAYAEIRRPGASEGQQLNKFMPVKDVEQALVDAGRAARESDWAAFLGTLDRASYGLTRRPPGKRLLIAILDGPAAAAVSAMRGGSEEARNRLAQALDFCKANGVTVMVVDPSPAAEKDLGGAIEALARGTGGALVRDPNGLGAGVLAAAPEEKAAETPEQTAGAGPAVPPANAVHVRLFRTYPMRMSATTDLGPMNGLLLVEAPMGALEFQTDDKSGNYLARARVTQIARNAEGKAVWRQNKEITIKGPLKKLAARRAGNLYYLREVKLPAGQYTLEATVEDLISGKTAHAAEPLRASDSLPGFTVSDAVFVKKMDDSVDKFEADQVLSYDRTALAPLLDPVFRANQAFDLQLYFIIYPDLQGAKPEIGVEIVSNGQTVAKSQLAFGDQLRNTTTEGGTMDVKGEQKHEFPFMATLVGNTFDAGAYEARVAVRQGGRSVARVVSFQVVEGK